MKACELIQLLERMPPNADVVHKVVDKVYQPIQSVGIEKSETSKMLQFQVVLITNNPHE